MTAGATLAPSARVLKVFTDDPTIRVMLERAASWWNRATPGAPVIQIVQDEELANTVVMTTDKWNREWQGRYQPHPRQITGIMGGGSIQPSFTEQKKIQRNFGYRVNGVVGDQAISAYVRFINKTEQARARVNALRTPEINTPTETRTIMVAPKLEPETLADRAKAHKPVPV